MLPFAAAAFASLDGRSAIETSLQAVAKDGR
jgi:hypothetical protein